MSPVSATTLRIQLRVDVAKTADQATTYRLTACAAPPTSTKRKQQLSSPVIAERAFASWQDFAAALSAIGFSMGDLQVLQSMLEQRQSAVIGGFNLQRADWDGLGFSDSQRAEAETPTVREPSTKEETR
jgi:hypothetical protein